MRVRDGVTAFLMASVATVGACRDSSAPGPTLTNVRTPPPGPVLAILNGDMFNLTQSCTEQAGLTADLDGALNVLYTGVSKKFTAAYSNDTSHVGWQNDADTPPQQYRTLIDGNVADYPLYHSAWLRAAQTTYNGLSTVFHVRKWRTTTTLFCRDVTATIRSSDPVTWNYIVSTVAGWQPATSWPLAVGEAYYIGSQPKNVDGYYVPVLANDPHGDAIPSANLSVTSSSSAVTLSAVTNSQWNFGYATMTGAQPGTAKARFSLRGFVDSSFTINVCSPSKDVATALYLSPNGPLTLEIYQDSTFNVLTTNCAGHTPGGSVTWSSDNPSVASVNAQGRVSPRQAGTARIIAQRNAVADTVFVTVPTPEIHLDLVGPWSVRADASCAWQVYATAYAPGSFHYSWTKDGIPIGYDQSYVTGVATGWTQFGIFVTVTHTSGLYPPATISRNVTIDPNAPNCAE